MKREPEGSLHGGSEEVRLANVSQGIGQFEVQLGHDFALGNGSSLTPFTGFAVRRLTDRSGGEESDNGALGYDREVVYPYLPLGLAYRTPIGRSALTISGQYNHLLGGRVKSKFSEIDPEFPDVVVNLDGGSGLELSAIVDVPLGRKALRVGPFVRRWSVKDSEVTRLTNPEDPSEALEFVEPRSRTTEVGVRLSIAF